MNEVASSQPSLDVTQLEKVRYAGEKITARCPACAEGGGDRSGTHLVILASGKFACAAAQGDQEHRRRIFALAGLPLEPREQRQWNSPTERQRQRIALAKAAGERRVRERIAATAAARRAGLIATYAWEPADVVDDSPHCLDSRRVRHGPRTFLSSLFHPDALLWAGETHHSGQEGRYGDHWKTTAEWCAGPTTGIVGPMTTPAVWLPGTTSRAAVQVAAAPYVVLDFDGFDGRSPETEEERHQHVLASLAIIRWLRERLHWRLAAILHTGNKSLHAWFHTPRPEVLESLRAPALSLGLDANLLGRPEHPCRLPGQRHGKSGRLSEVWWLQAQAGL